MGQRIARQPGIIGTAAGLFAPSGAVESAKDCIELGPDVLMPPIDLENPEKTTIKLLNEAVDAIYLPSEGRKPQYTAAKYINREATGELMVVENGYGGNVTSVDDTLRLTMLGLIFPESPILMMDYYGHGGSSRFTRKQRKEWQRGSLDDCTDRRLEAFKEFLAEYRKDRDETYSELDVSAGNIAGLSRHIKLLDEDNVKPSNHTAIEMPGSNITKTRQVNMGYFGYESLVGVALRSHKPGMWLWDYTKEFEEALVKHTDYDPKKTAPGFERHDKRMFMANLRRNVVVSGFVKKMLDQVIEAELPVARISSLESRVDNAHVAVRDQRELLDKTGKSFDLLAITDMSHELTGYLGFNWAIFNAAKELRDASLQPAREPEVRYTDLRTLIEGVRN